jgi:hypothetical protein
MWVTPKWSDEKRGDLPRQEEVVILSIDRFRDPLSMLKTAVWRPAEAAGMGSDWHP